MNMQNAKPKTPAPVNMMLPTVKFVARIFCLRNNAIRTALFIAAACIGLAQTPKLNQGQSGPVHWFRYANPPQNLYVIETAPISGLTCVVVTGRMLDGGRNSTGDERPIRQIYTLTEQERYSGITRPRFVNLGRGHLLAIEFAAKLENESCK